MNLSGHVQRAVLRRVVSLPAPVTRLIAGPRVVSPDGATLDVEAQILLRFAKLAGRPDVADLGAQRGREDMERSVPIVDFRRITVKAFDRTVPGPRGAIPVRIYHPRSRPAPCPVLVFFHGGGFVVGSIASHDGLCRALAEKTDAIVVSVAYGLAPEQRFPAGVDDGVAATRWVIANAASFGGDPRAVAVGGDSAGGNIAAVVAQETRDDAVSPVFQLLVYPATDLTRSLPSHRLFAEGYMLTKRSMDWYLANYVTEAEKTTPRASPLFASPAVLRGIAPALVFTAGFDPLRDEGRAYAEKMTSAGVPVEYQCVEGGIHGFFSCGGVFAHARRAVDDASHALRRAFERGSGAGSHEPIPHHERRAG
jgi:acetyl esterase